MKKFIDNNSRTIIVICMVLLTIGFLTYVGMSYGAGNSPIYTRDELSEKVDNLEYDTGWVSLIPYIDPAFTYVQSRPPEIRRIGKVVYLRGSLTGNTITQGTIINMLSGIPREFRPTVNIYITNAVGNTNNDSTFRLTIQTTGAIVTSANSYGTLPETSQYIMECVYFVN